jgi:glyoxylase-like metal-dependent hydrolase (beta-lactamase superfamily II)
MALEIINLQLGPMDNNSYLIADRQTKEAVVIDPSFESEQVLQEAQQRGWTLTAVWLTHAHFDHIAGVKTVSEATNPPLPVGLHPLDLPLWRQAGGARNFGIQLETGPDPQISFAHGQMLKLGGSTLEVRHTPGHTPGHIVLYSVEDGTVFCGDLIFYRGVGRTDLPGGDHSTLMRSIREQILPLPPNTRLLSGHGPKTTVEEEAVENPFL